MSALWTKLVDWAQSDRGASMVEYALLVTLIAIVSLVAIQFAGSEVSEMFSEVASGVSA